MAGEQRKKFEEKYRVELDSTKRKEIVKGVKKTYKQDRKRAYPKGVEDHAHQIISIIGMELERLYPEVEFTLFGRRKSKQSSKIKIKNTVRDLESEFEKLGENEKKVIELRPIYDYYGLKFVVEAIPERTVREFAKDDEEIRNLNQMRHDIMDYLYEVDVESNDIHNMTYGQYATIMLRIRERLAAMAYDESVEEKKSIMNTRDTITSLIDKNEEIKDDVIDEKYIQTALDELKQAEMELLRKKDDKIQLLIGSKMIKEIVENSSILKRHGEYLSYSPDRTKRKRTPKGYIADFYSMDVFDDINFEIQVQSSYRYEYGEKGPAAHHKMENDLKKRFFYEKPNRDGLTKKIYKKWEKKQLKPVPRYFTYKKGGRVHIYDTIDNFRRYYDCEDKRLVEEYVSFIRENGNRFLSKGYTGYNEVKIDPNKLLGEDEVKADSSELFEEIEEIEER